MYKALDQDDQPVHEWICCLLETEWRKQLGFAPGEASMVGACPTLSHASRMRPSCTVATVAVVPNKNHRSPAAFGDMTPQTTTAMKPTTYRLAHASSSY